MMKCDNCQTELPEDAAYCEVCGQGVEPVPEGDDWAPVLSETDVPVTVPAAKVFCPHCGASMYAGYEYCWQCGRSRAEQTAVAEAGKPKNNALKALLFIAAGIVLALAIVLTAGFCTDWFGLTGPAVRIGSAASKTFESGNLTVDMDLKRDLEGVHCVAAIDMDPEKREITAVIEYSSDNAKAEFAICDRYMLMSSDGIDAKIDLSGFLDKFFDAYEAGTGSSSESFLKSVSEAAYEAAGEYIDFSEMDGCLVKYSKKLNSKKWLKDNAGYYVVKDGRVKMHTFEPHMDTFLTATYDVFKDAVKETEGDAPVTEWVEALKSSYKDEDVKVQIGIEGGKLVRLDAASQSTDEGFEIGMTFSQIGTTQIDKDALRSRLDSAYDIGDMFG